MRKNILVVVQDFPYPLDYAGPIDSYNKIKALHENGFNVYLVATIKEQVKDEYMDVMNKFCIIIQLVHRQHSVKNLFSLLPFQMKSRINEHDIYKIRHAMAEVNFDDVICDGYYGIELMRRLVVLQKIENIFLRVNNNEIKYFYALFKSTKNIFKKMYYISDMVKFYIHESFVLPKIGITAMLHVSYDEKESYEIKFPNYEHYFLPAAVDITNINEYKKSDNKKVLFIGSLFMPNNVEALIWYIENVHGALTKCYSDYSLIVAGNVRGADINNLEKLFSRWKNISFVKSPKDLTALYDEAMIFINPMLNGAGVKLKTLNAICAGVPVVSTIIGNEGTGLVKDKHILVTSDKDIFYKYVTLLMENENKRKDLVNNGQKFLTDTYNQTVVLQKIFCTAQ
jgi:polysaccharide biosynthesis protein PslH